MIDKTLVQNAQEFLMSGGSAARAFFKSGLNVNALRTNDLLRKEDWQELDQTLVDIGRQRLIGINDLINRGLSFRLKGLGTTISQYEQISDMSEAQVDFSAVTEGERDAVTFDLVSIPVPIFHKTFSIDLRRLAASRDGIGPAIDRTQVEVATKKVVEQMEEVLFNGVGNNVGTLPVGGGSSSQAALYGYTNEPHVNSSAGSDWGTETAPQTSIISAIGVEEADFYYGPYTVYVPKTQFNQLRNFFTDGSGDQIFDRVARIQGIQDVRPADRLADGTALMVAMTRDVVDLAIGQDLTVVEWESKGGMLVNFKVMGALAARIKYDSLLNSGICKITGI